MFSGTHSLKRAPGLGSLPASVFPGMWRQSDGVGAAEDRNHELVKQRGLHFQAGESEEYSQRRKLAAR